MSWWARFGAWGVAVEQDMGRATDMPPGAASMIVGVYVGLVMGTLVDEYGAMIRRELEVEMAAAMGLPPEALESQMRELLASKVRGR